uniref:Esterase n=1 Tax=candidate division WOR-3 bacterium TaxID=2052148 RepID=A0A7C4CBM5_UNCW3
MVQSIAVGFLLTLAASATDAGPTQGSYGQSLEFGGRRRTYLLHLPDMTADYARPLVFVLHGGGGSGRAVARLTGFNRLADSAGFIVVYPDGVERHWNDGRGVKRFAAQREGVDDVGFIAALIDTLVLRLGADPTRVYVTGMSNGAMMCHRLGLELAGKIAAIAPVAGNLPVKLAEKRPVRPVAVLAINGTDDPLVPFEGGGVGLVAKRGKVLSTAQTVQFWVERNGCSPAPETAWVDDADPDDGIRVARAVYSGGREGTEVILYTVLGGGHTWPQGAERPGHFGRTARDFSASGEIWRFFARHRR